jgi:hypothetical protein
MYMYIHVENIILLCRFRCGNHRLPIESGRWQNIPRQKRLCHLCDSREMGDEYHYTNVLIWNVRHLLRNENNFYQTSVLNDRTFTNLITYLVQKM